MTRLGYPVFWEDCFDSFLNVPHTDLAALYLHMEITMAVSMSIGNNFEWLVHAKQHTKCFTHFASLGLNPNFMKWDYFTDEKTIILQMRKLRF